MLGPDPNKSYPITLDLNFFELKTLRESVQRSGGVGLQIKFDAAVHETNWLTDWNEYPDERRIDTDETDTIHITPNPHAERAVSFVLFLLVVAQLSFGIWVFFM